MEWVANDYYTIWLSLKVAVVAVLAALPLGFLAAYALSGAPFRGKFILEMLVNLPLTLPPVVVGYLLLLLLGHHGWLGSWLNAAGIRVLFTWKAAVVASMVVGFPLLVRSIRLSMESLDPKVVASARSLGATHLDALFSVVAPMSWRGITAGSLLMFARSLGEFGATVMVAGNIPGVTQTIPLAIYDYAGSPGGNAMALWLCGVSLAISLAVIVLHERLGKRWGKLE